MCAINGIVGKRDGALERMLAATKHRGPDGTHMFFDGQCSLGFNRLAIIDLSERGMQPMTDPTGRYTLVYNGEVYNYQALKQELRDYPFQSESDSEVVLAAYSRWGTAAFKRLNGMFALAVWDAVEQKLVLARDPMGVKPLYYFFDGTTLLFSSEIKALLAAGVPSKVNQEALTHYFRLLYVPTPLTFFENVRALTPGSLLTYRDRTLSSESYQEVVPCTNRTIPYDEACTAVRQKVREAVERQLVSDRPVGLYLSGGIDSSVLLSVAARAHPRINTYAVGFHLGTEEEQEKFNADALLAKNTAQHFGAEHHEFLITSDEARATLAEVVAYLDQPIANATAIAQLFLARKVKPTATVVLTGDGGDEVFGGYERYRLAYLAHTYGSFFPTPLAKLLGLPSLTLTPEDRHAQLMFTKEAILSRVLKTPLPEKDTRAYFKEFMESSLDIRSALMHTDMQTWLIDEALARTDTMSMAGSVEARVPLLDLEVVRYLSSLPPSYKVTHTQTKKILRDAFSEVLPQAVREAPKRGWFSPGAKWLRRPEFVALFEEVLQEIEAGSLREVFSVKDIRVLWEEHQTKKQYHYTILWAVLVMVLWARTYRVSL